MDGCHYLGVWGKTVQNETPIKIGAFSRFIALNEKKSSISFGLFTITFTKILYISGLHTATPRESLQLCCTTVLNIYVTLIYQTRHFHAKTNRLNLIGNRDEKWISFYIGIKVNYWPWRIFKVVNTLHMTFEYQFMRKIVIILAAWRWRIHCSGRRDESHAAAVITAAPRFLFLLHHRRSTDETQHCYVAHRNCSLYIVFHPECFYHLFEHFYIIVQRCHKSGGNVANSLPTSTTILMPYAVCTNFQVLQLFVEWKLAILPTSLIAKKSIFCRYVEPRNSWNRHSSCSFRSFKMFTIRSLTSCRLLCIRFWFDLRLTCTIRFLKLLSPPPLLPIPKSSSLLILK